jgi:rSAM/selenodomain-associated transferase 1
VVTIVVFAKAPVPGRVKTRLCPPCTQNEASAIAQACLIDTLSAVASVPCDHHVVALDGELGAWLPRGFRVLPQRGNGLAERLSAVFEDVGPALVVGMDTPQVTTRLLTDSVDRLTRPNVDAVLGRSLDGGYWTIGLRQPDPRVFERVPMSVAWTGKFQLRRLTDLDLVVENVPALRDVDTFEDALSVAREAPTSATADAVASTQRRIVLEPEEVS